MADAIRRHFELADSRLPALAVFADDEYVRMNTMLQREIFDPNQPRIENNFQYDRYDMLRGLAPITGRGADPVGVQAEEKDIIQIPPVQFRISVRMTGEELNAVRAPGQLTDNAATILQIRKRQLRLMAALTLEKLCAMCLQGTTTIDASVFPAETTVVGVSISWGNTTLAVSASWNTTGTLIVSNDVRTMNAAVVDASGLPIGGFLYNESISKMLDKNDQVAEFLSGLPRFEQFFTAAQQRLANMGGVERWMEYKGSYKPIGGSVTRFLSDNELLSLPVGYQEFLKIGRGPMDIPQVGVDGCVGRSGDIRTTPGEGPDVAYGYSEYAIQRSRNPSLELIGQGSFAVVNKFPEAFGLEADVTS